MANSVHSHFYLIHTFTHNIVLAKRVCVCVLLTYFENIWCARDVSPSRVHILKIFLCKKKVELEPGNINLMIK